MSAPIEIYNADVVLRELNRQYVFFPLPLLESRLRGLFKPSERPMLFSKWLDMILEKLERDKYIIVRNTVNSLKESYKEYNISFEGAVFIRNGGYVAQYAKEEWLKKLNEDHLKVILSAHKSDQKVNRFQRGFLGFATATAIVSVIMSCVTWNRISSINPNATPLILNTEPMSQVPDSMNPVNKREGVSKTALQKASFRKESN